MAETETFDFHPVNSTEYVLRWSGQPNGGIRMVRKEGDKRRLVQVRLTGLDFAYGSASEGGVLFVMDRRTARLLARRILEALDEGER